MSDTIMISYWKKGFGFSENESGLVFRVPHYGGGSIGDNVDIGATTTVVRGTIDNTVIEDDVKIDNLCHIAHNDHVGKHTLIIANTSVY